MRVNGIELKEGQIWKTKNYGVVTLSDSGVNANYPWRMNFPNNGDPIGSITTDGKYWEEDEMPELLECIYNPEDKEEKKPMKFNPKSEPTKLFLPKPGDKIICNNGEEFICCTLGFLHENGLAKCWEGGSIFGYQHAEDNPYTKCDWQYWDETGRGGSEEWSIREVIPQSLETPADKKEEVKEEPRYTVEEVIEAFSNALHLSWMGGHKEGIEKVKDYLEKKSNKEYQEYLRLKAIYE